MMEKRIGYQKLCKILLELTNDALGKIHKTLRQLQKHMIWETLNQLLCNVSWGNGGHCNCLISMHRMQAM